MAPGTPRMLVVEDDAEGREPLTEVLGLQGYDATSVGDGRTAIERIRSGEFDVVVLDLGLPDIAGVEIIRAARALPDGPAVVVFTGHHRLRAAAEAAGCDAFILKPNLDELLARVSTAIAARAGRSVAAPPSTTGKVRG